LLLIGGVAVGAATPFPFFRILFSLPSPFVGGSDAWIVKTGAALAGRVLTIKKMISLEKMRDLRLGFFRKACQPEAIHTPSNGINSMTPARFRMLLDHRINGRVKQFRRKIIHKRHLMSP
jgi:hypothetical protein